MRYRSDVVIGIHKTILARHLISPEIPKELYELSYALHDDIAYFFVNNWKWYPAYPEIATIERWFAALVDEQSGARFGNEVPIIFGALRMGENDEDIETWGDPHEFDICLNRSIGYPIQAMNKLEAQTT